MELAQPPLRKTNGKRSLIWQLITHVFWGVHESRQTQLSTVTIRIQILAFEMRCSGGYTDGGMMAKRKKERVFLGSILNF